MYIRESCFLVILYSNQKALEDGKWSVGVVISKFGIIFKLATAILTCAFVPVMFNLEASVPIPVTVAPPLFVQFQTASVIGCDAVNVPVPEPTPVGVNVTPTVFADAPMAVKSVLPTDTIVEVNPTTKAPAVKTL